MFFLKGNSLATNSLKQGGTNDEYFREISAALWGERGDSSSLHGWCWGEAGDGAPAQLPLRGAWGGLARGKQARRVLVSAPTSAPRPPQHRPCAGRGGGHLTVGYGGAHIPHPRGLSPPRRWRPREVASARLSLPLCVN